MKGNASKGLDGLAKSSQVASTIANGVRAEVTIVKLIVNII
jgi:hypothetical protein